MPPTPSTDSGIPDTPDSCMSIGDDDAPLLPPQFEPATTADIVAAWELGTAVPPQDPLQVTPEFEGGMHRVLESFDRVLAEVVVAMPELPPDQQDTLDVMQAIVAGETPDTAPGTAARMMAEDLREELEKAEQAKKAPLTDVERCQVVVDTVGSMLHATMRDDPEAATRHRFLANYGIPVIKTLLVVGGSTLLRQMVGYAIERLLQTHGVDNATRTAIGMAALALGPGMLIAGAVRDHRNETATNTSLCSRLFMMSASAAAAALVYLSGGAAKMASFGIQGVSYALTRDTLQAFLPTQDNSRIDVTSTLLAGAIWSLEQIGASVLMDRFAPNSGAGFAMNSESLYETFENCTATATAAMAGASTPAEQESAIQSAVCAVAAPLWAALTATMTHSALRGAINAVPEITDDWIRQRLSLRNTDERLQLRVDPRWPTGPQIADQFLTTSGARTAAMTNIVAVVLAAAELFGDKLPKGVAGDFVLGTIAAAACMVIYPPLIGVHDRNVRPTSDKIGLPAPDASEPVQAVRYERTSDSAV